MVYPSLQISLAFASTSFLSGEYHQSTVFANYELALGAPEPPG
jgi:hypothetical protein